MRFTRKEVEEFLMENGFDDPDEETLRKFMKDLQKLIKYDEQRRRRQLLGHERDDTVLDTTAHTSANVTSLNSPDQNTSGHDNGQGNTVYSARHRSLRVSRGTGDVGGGRRSSNQSSENELTQLEPGKIRNRRKSEDVTDLKGNSTVVSVPKESAQEKYNRLLASMSDRKSDPAPPSVKQGNRLIMKRLTFTQGEDGASFIEESDVDLGRRRQNLRPNRPNLTRPATQIGGLSQTVQKSDFDSVRRRRLTTHSSTQEADRTRRPQTAPALQRASQSKGAHTVPGDQRGAVGRSNSDHPPDQPQPDNAVLPESNSLEDIEPDELFYALNELIFPSRSESSDDSVSTTSEKYKSLPQPPPHVAIDPVSLYHWYKTYSWDVFSIPGEDKHMKLRWNVRAKTIGGHHPCVEARRIVRKPQSSRPARNPIVLKQCA